MHAQNFLVNDSSNWKAVETVSESFPKFDVVSSLALVIEAIDSVDTGALVISSEKEEVLRVLDFVCQKKADGFETLLSSVNIVSEEKVVCLWRETSILEKSEEIIVLAMDITANLDWGFQLEENWLVDENVS